MYISRSKCDVSQQLLANTKRCGRRCLNKKKKDDEEDSFISQWKAW
jgi:hypothetical protein